MPHPSILKERAVRFRQNGFSYSEIMDFVHVSQATLSSWLRDVSLSDEHKDRLSRIKRRGNLRGARSRNTDRLEREEIIKHRSFTEISPLSSKDVWFAGVLLYWAEGSKESSNNPGSGVIFANQDARMIRVFLKFLIDTCTVSRSDIYFEIYIHDDRRSDERKILRYWMNQTQFSQEYFKTYFKYTTRSDNRQNGEKLYHGVLRVRVRSSSALLRRIAGWTEGIVYQFCGIV